MKNKLARGPSASTVLDNMCAVGYEWLIRINNRLFYQSPQQFPQGWRGQLQLFASLGPPASSDLTLHYMYFGLVWLLCVWWSRLQFLSAKEWLNLSCIVKFKPMNIYMCVCMYICMYIYIYLSMKKPKLIQRQIQRYLNNFQVSESTSYLKIHS